MKKYSQITLSLIFTTLFFISLNANSAESSAKVTACNAALDKSDSAAALSIAEEILKAQSNHREALLCKGRALGAQGNYDAALSALDMAAKQSQSGFDEIITYLLTGNLHKANNKHAEAIAAYEKSLEISETEKLDKFKRISLNLMGETHVQNKDLDAALARYLAGSKLAMNDNERADSYERLGMSYSALGQHDLAIEYQLKGMLMQQKSGTLDQYAESSLALGQVYRNAKEYANAEKTYTKLIQFAKDNGGAYYEAKASYDLAQMQAASGNATGAKNLMENALKLAESIGDATFSAEIKTEIKKLNN
jgi:tetratricopeptide (TPR) repeat protein